ncbi:retron-type reverse transcriptase [Bradyrhizobium japonicum]
MTVRTCAEFFDRRVTDGIVRRMIDKWLKAGMLEKGVLRRTTGGTPQGGVISPLLANIYLLCWMNGSSRWRDRGSRDAAN